MKVMKDRNGKVIHEDELIKIVDRPDIMACSADYWTVFDVIEVGVFTDFILRNVITKEIKVIPQGNIQRTY